MMAAIPGCCESYCTLFICVHSVFSCNWLGAQNFFQNKVLTDVNLCSLTNVTSFALLTLRRDPQHCALTWDVLQKWIGYSECSQVHLIKRSTVAKRKVFQTFFASKKPMNMTVRETKHCFANLLLEHVCCTDAKSVVRLHFTLLMQTCPLALPVDPLTFFDIFLI
jgi:hypothetical protein